MYNIERLQTRFEHGFEVQKLSTNQWRSCSRSFPESLLTRGQSPGWLKNILIKQLENLKKARKAQGKDFRRLLSLDFENISGAQSLPQSATNGLEVNHKAICSHFDSSVQAENFCKPWEASETYGYSARPVKWTANVGLVCLLTFLNYLTLTAMASCVSYATEASKTRTLASRRGGSKISFRASSRRWSNAWLTQFGTRKID